MKTYKFTTIDQDGAYELHFIEAFNLKEALKIRVEYIGRSKSGQEPVGRITLK